jgi:hypothetical protein
MPKLIKGIVPPGGWHFIQDGVTLKASGHTELVKTVEAFRAENELPIGDVEQEITDQVCARTPQSCHGVDSVLIKVHKATVNDKNTLIRDISVWASNLLRQKTPFRLVGDELAESRSQICRKCPENVNWRGGCRSCITAADRVCATVRQARDTKSSKVLGGCQKLRHDNRTAIFLEKEFLSTDSSVPDYCWLNS